MKMDQIKYQIEHWSDIEDELKTIFPLHWKELGQNQDVVFLEPAYEKYKALDKAEILNVVTVRSNNKLVGYYVSIITQNLHYSSCKTAFCDIYYLLPEYRKGFIGLNLFKFMEQEVTKLGVKKIFTMTKVQSDNSSMLKRLGYNWVEKIYSKIIG